MNQPIDILGNPIEVGDTVATALASGGHMRILTVKEISSDGYPCWVTTVWTRDDGRDFFRDLTFYDTQQRCLNISKLESSNEN